MIRSVTSKKLQKCEFFKHYTDLCTVFYKATLCFRNKN